MDGLDLALVDFFFKNRKWKFKIVRCSTVPYNINLIKKLAGASDLSGWELAQLDVEFGKYIAEKAIDFISGIAKKPLFIAIHGQTVFHKPPDGVTYQLGHGAPINALTQLPVICDFRSVDVALGGQGAPLVPMGELHLFPENKIFVNLGGIANISCHYSSNNILAYDVAACNILTNFLAHKTNKSYDKKGEIAAKGRLLPGLLKKLNNFPYFKLQPPKSLHRDTIEQNYFQLFEDIDNEIEDLMATVVEHISHQIAISINTMEINSDVLVTGGGAYNEFLIEKLRAKSKKNIIVPKPPIIEFKEAVIFAFLGILRLLNTPNCLASVTGAPINSINGSIYGDFGSILSNIRN